MSWNSEWIMWLVSSSNLEKGAKGKVLRRDFLPVLRLYIG